MHLVVYSDGEEVLVTTQCFEADFLHEYFEEGGRGLDTYDRREFENVVEIKAKARVWGDRELTA